MGRNGWDEVSETGALFFSGCSPIDADGIKVEVSEAYDDSNTSRNAVLLDVHGGLHGIGLILSPDEAEALSAILRHTAKEVRRMTEVLDARAIDYQSIAD